MKEDEKRSVYIMYGNGLAADGLCRRVAVGGHI